MSQCYRLLLVLTVVVLSGCAAMAPVPPETSEQPSGATESSTGQIDAAGRYLTFMNRAAGASGEQRQGLLRDLERSAARGSSESRLRLGLLLTSPVESLSTSREGESMLRKILAGNAGLEPDIRALVELRLREVAVREALQTELHKANGMVEDLMSIESSMEEQRIEAQGQSR